MGGNSFGASGSGFSAFVSVDSPANRRPPRPTALPSAPPARGANPTDVTCGHCGWTSTIRPPDYAPNPRPSTPARFAIKCLGDSENSEPCRRVRVFSYLDVSPPGPTLSEVVPILPLYEFIHEMSEYGGRREKIAGFLVAACDLHMFGLLETGPESRDAAFAGAAVHLRKAAELFLRRVILQEREHPLSNRSIGDLLKRLKKSPPPTLRSAARPTLVARRLQFIFDVGNIAAHPEVSQPRLRWLKYRLPVTDGTIRRSLSYFDEVAGMVKWK